MVTGRKWTEEDLEFIKNNYKTMNDEELAIKLNRSVSSINTKRKRLGCTLTNRKYNWDTVLDLFCKTDYILISDENDYKDAATKSIRYICPHHKDKGIQKIAIGHMINGEGCRYCGINRRAKKNMVNFDELEDEFKKICNEKDFEYLGYERTDKKVKICFICNKHRELGEQQMLVGSFRQSKGCKYCARKDLPVWYIENELKENVPNIEILEPFTMLTDVVKCKCSVHGTENVKQVNKILAGEACHKCTMSKRKGSWCEDKICNILDEWGYEYERQYTFNGCRDRRKLPFDFYLTYYNVCIEFDGPQHYEAIYGEQYFRTTVYHDRLKDKYCNENGIILIRIPYWEFRNIECYLFDEFIKYGLIEKYYNEDDILEM